MSNDRKQLAVALKRVEAMKRNKCFDAYRPDSRPIPKQQEIFDDLNNVTCRYVVAANQSGKTQMGAREAAWLFEGTHPFFDTKKAWGKRPLTMLIIGKTTRILQQEIWENKIAPLLTPGSYKTTIIGSTLQSVKHKKTGNTIVFISHNNVNEARKNSQGYVAQWVWLDEMPDAVSLFSELITRIIASKGKFLATFTPLIRSWEIKNLVESSKLPIAKKYQLNMLDNPIYENREEEILATFSHFPEMQQRARLYGDWFVGESGVYTFDPSKMSSTPKDYNYSWRHIEVIDPAARGKAGFCILAEDPDTAKWYLVHSEYIDGNSASKLLAYIRPKTLKYNIVRRICDPHEVWFIKGAADEKRQYQGVYKKNERKKELIKQVQEALNSGLLNIAPWNKDVIEELTTCQWSETQRDKIVGATRFHLLDCLQYGIDSLPKAIPHHTPQNWEQKLRESNKRRKKAELEAVEKKKRIARIIRRPRGKRL